MKPGNRSISTVGLTLAGIYAAASAVCVVLALSAHDPKGAFVLLQLPIALQAAMLPDAVLDLLEHTSWPVACAVFGMPTLAALYLLGAALGSTARRCLAPEATSRQQQLS